MCACAIPCKYRIPRRRASTLIVLASLFGQAGCEKYSDDRPPFVEQQQEPDCVLTIAVDLSGSFAELMAKDGKAYRFALHVVDRYFRERMGSADKIIIAQISATEKPLLWDGSPIALRQSFPNAQAFRDFLLANSNPGGSRVHDGVADTIDYVLAYPGVANGKTRSAIFVLSDMLDNAPDSEKSKERLLQSLTAYRRAGGVVALYWVDQRLVPEWRRHVNVVESEIVDKPTLPSFE